MAPKSTGKHRWSRQALLKYTALQVPGAILLIAALFYFQERLGISLGAIVLIVVLWVAKDVFLFPFVWRAYESRHEEDPLIGAKAVARERLNPKGYVRVRGELWRASLQDASPPVEEGETVLVTGREGLTLLVERPPTP